VVEVDSFSITKTFSNMMSKYINAFVYVWFHPKIGLWMGATPEKLVSIENNQFKTMALAGTQPYTKNVKWNTKEIIEQELVTTYITSKLESIHLDFNVSKPYTVKAGALAHIRTDITGSFNFKNDLASILKIMHPTPAVCGMPKQIAKEFILDNENYNREYYTGFLGELNLDNNSHLFVNLRCMQVLKTKILIYVGGGITMDSNAEKEWQETVEKSKIMKKILAN